MQLFLTSFLILFIELALIRFIPAYIQLAGYFTNIIVIASFLGIGIGMILAKKFSYLFSFFPFVLLLLLMFVLYFQVQIAIPKSEVLFFTDSLGKFTPVQPTFLLPFLYIAIVLPFVCLGQLLGKLFSLYKPLVAYSLDIYGGIFGILAFSLLSFFMTPPIVWFSIITAVFLFLEYMQHKMSRYIISSILFFTGILVMLFFTLTANTFWSPYYKIRVWSEIHMLIIDVNNIAHQYISNFGDRQAFYYAPYQAFQNHFYKNVLIIGAGTGADTATALNLDSLVTHIDAVEIDPKIYELGHNLNPNKPFDDPRVTVHIDDGRNFLHNTTQKYDLIIYAVTDSLILSSNTANVRLESFLFTTDAFKEVKQHLNANGLFVMYNYYREKWLIDKLASMTQAVFGYPPHVYTFEGVNKAAIIATGPRSQTLPKTSILKPYTPKIVPPPAEDSWPFLYLKEKTIPSLYLTFLPILLIISLIFFGTASYLTKQYKFDVKMFFLGAAFLLLETKSLVLFSLIFGNTWIINSISFGGILLFVLLANRISINKTIPLYYVSSALLLVLCLSIFIPPSSFLTMPWIIRIPAACLFYFSPIFLANLIFSQAFKNTKDSQTSFASNLLGAVVGGFAEYASLAIGYPYLTILIIFFYALALITKKLS